ncbi:flagellar hook-length control protein FliK [Vibrio ziniensis]|uniref:flagellar hook-length control protein FliK n=1 Tax=Vibrio ziniensis TaxID=2711221 RepID=UPI001FE529F4|nr:flagellar hook-length control protein FliK [Vibrio ziniensis]
MQGLSVPQQGAMPNIENGTFSGVVTRARGFSTNEEGAVEVFSLGQPSLLISATPVQHEDQTVSKYKTDEQTASEDTEQTAQATVVNSLTVSVQHVPLTAHEKPTAQMSLVQTILPAQSQVAEIHTVNKGSALLDNNLLSTVSSELVSSTTTQASPSIQSVPNQPATYGTSVSMVDSRPEWASVKVDTQAGKWGEQMLQVLHDRVTLQAQQNLQEAKIRLDPPDLGKLDLVVRVEGDRLSVQINASTAATREALMQVSERLRAELQEQNFVHVDVNVGSGQRERQQEQRFDDQSNIIFAAKESSLEPSYTPMAEHWLNTQA